MKKNCKKVAIKLQILNLHTDFRTRKESVIEANFLDHKKSNSIEPKKNQWKPNSPTKKTSTRGPGKNIKIDLTYP